MSAIQQCMIQSTESGLFIWQCSWHQVLASVCGVCCGSGWSSCRVPCCFKSEWMPVPGFSLSFNPHLLFWKKKLNSARTTDSIFGSHFHDKVNIWRSPARHFDVGSCIFKQPHKHSLWTLRPPPQTRLKTVFKMGKVSRKSLEYNRKRLNLYIYIYIYIKYNQGFSTLMAVV